MTGATVLALGWATLVLWAGWRHRPRRSRVPHLLRSDLRPSGSPVLRWLAVHRIISALGRTLRRCARRPPDPAADRWVGVVVSAAVIAGVAVSPVVGIALAAALAIGRRRFRGRQRARASDQVAADLPDLVDLLVLAAGSGLTVPLAVDAVGRQGAGPVAAALAEASRLRALGTSTSDALTSIAERHEAMGPLVAVLVSSDRYGTPLVPALEKLSAEVRLRRRRRAEEIARQVPVKLIFPLVLCALPAVALLTVVPLLLATLGSLDL